MGLMDAISAIDWEKESYPLYEDFVFIPIFAVFFPSVRFFLDRFIFEKCARRSILGKGNDKLIVDAEERRKLSKFKESAWKFVYFLSAEILALSVTYNEPWFMNTKCFWVGPGEQVWPDQKTKFARVGSIVLALHDGSDVFLEVGKMSKYSGYEGIASVSFILFVTSWVILRLTYYPFWILRSTSYEVLLVLHTEAHKVDGTIYYYVFNTLLFCLLVLHIYWWVLMYRMLVKQVKARGQLGDDVRSDSEGEDEHED
ncbi:ceramide synthase 1 LOH3 isoform X3 [Magnolia sinica]|uniref:ceramide synthase 1 LOH3 isoform X3 n=1 Tax=Magnolia sinica TaxID=86752 RepID=UPI002659ACF0|nr:ceramide synthase 1 LOH3 isoform X3 [Magnolia sinica]